MSNDMIYLVGMGLCALAVLKFVRIVFFGPPAHIKGQWRHE